VVLLDKINDGSGPTEKTRLFLPECWLGSQRDTELNVPNESDQQMKLMILKFKDTPPKGD
jgi:hypothetical protein